MIYYVSRLRLVSDCASDLAASSAPPSRPVHRVRTAQVVTESTRNLFSLAYQLKTATASNALCQLLSLPQTHHQHSQNVCLIPGASY